MIVDDLALVRGSDLCLALGVGGVWKGELACAGVCLPEMDLAVLCPCHLQCLGTAQEGSPIVYTVAYISGHARIPTHRAGKPGKRLVPLELTGGGDREVLIKCRMCVW